MSPAGLHLWFVVLDCGGASLWITTKIRSTQLVARKADAYIRSRPNLKCFGTRVRSIEYRGTIDV